MNLGLTGGIATGKSTVVDFLRDFGANIIDADQIAREVVEPNHPALSKVVEAFGSDVLHVNGTLHRKKLGEIIFSDPAKKKLLESILHPEIRKLMFGRMDKYELQQPDKLVVVDVPLLYESKLQDRFDEVMVVYIPIDLQLKRLQQRDHIDQATALQKVKSQISIEEKKSLADVVINNSGTIRETKKQLDEYLQRKGLI